MPTQRLDNFGKINREKVLSFSWENKNCFGYEGDSLASALLANNIQIVGRSFKYHRPRGIMSCGVEESGGLVTVGNDDRRDPNVCATTQELYQGLITSGQNAFPNETRPYIDESVSYDSYPQNAEKVNGRWAMIGFVALLGAYVTTGQIIPGIF